MFLYNRIYKRMSSNKQILLEEEDPRIILVKLQVTEEKDLSKYRNKNDLKEELNKLVLEKKKEKEKKLQETNRKFFKTPIYVYQTERTINGKKEYIMYLLKNNENKIIISEKPFKFYKKKNIIENFKNNEEGINNSGNKCFMVSSLHLLFTIFYNVKDKNRLIEISYEESDNLGNLIENLLRGIKISNDLIQKIVQDIIEKAKSKGESNRVEQFERNQCDSQEFISVFFEFFFKVYEYCKDLIDFEECTRYFLKNKSDQYIDLYNNSLPKKKKVRCIKGGGQINIFQTGGTMPYPPPPPPPPPPPTHFLSDKSHLDLIGRFFLSLNIKSNESYGLQTVIDQNFGLNSISNFSEGINTNQLTTQSINNKIYVKKYLKNVGKFIFVHLQISDNFLTTFKNFKLISKCNEYFDIPIIDKNKNYSKIKCTVHDVVYRSKTDPSGGHYISLCKRKNKWYKYDGRQKEEYKNDSFDIDGFIPYVLLLKKKD